MGRLAVSLRPLLIGFVVKPGDWNGLIKVVETASGLWGGMFFPIIPSYRRITGLLRREIPSRISARQFVSGYLDAFDPDVLVKVNDANMPATLAGNRKVISSTEIFERFSDDATPSFGIGASEVFSYFAATELTYLRRHPLKIAFPTLGKGYRAFLGSVFGHLRPDVEAAAKAAFPPGIEIETPQCSIENFAELLKHEILFTRRLMNQHLQIRSTEACVYFLNAGSTEDIVDYWNLRAAGWNVLPVPQQGCDVASIKKLAAQFVNENYWAHPDNPDFFHTQTSSKVATHQLAIW
jgi:hypothetical protein